jgi:predicted DNA-binding transcriptional regulator AlpA
MTSESQQFSPLLLSDKQVAKLLGCHRNTIWNRVRNDQLPSPIKWEGKTVWRRRDIEEFVATL